MLARQLTAVLFVVGLFAVGVSVAHPVRGDTDALILRRGSTLEEVLRTDTRQLSLRTWNTQTISPLVVGIVVDWLIDLLVDLLID